MESDFELDEEVLKAWGDRLIDWTDEKEIIYRKNLDLHDMSTLAENTEIPELTETTEIVPEPASAKPKKERKPYVFTPKRQAAFLKAQEALAAKRAERKKAKEAAVVM
jgi:hypothetical protein